MSGCKGICRQEYLCRSSVCAQSAPAVQAALGQWHTLGACTGLSGMCSTLCNLLTEFVRGTGLHLCFLQGSNV